MVVSSKVETSDVEIEATILVVLKQKGWNVKHVLSSKNIFWQSYLEEKNMACFSFLYRLIFLKLQNKSIGGDNRLYFAVFYE